LEVSNYEERKIKIKIELNINSHKMILAPSNENFFSLFKNMPILPFGVAIIIIFIILLL